MIAQVPSSKATESLLVVEQMPQGEKDVVCGDAERSL